MNRLWVRLSLSFSITILAGIVLIVVASLVFNRGQMLLGIVADWYQRPDGLVDRLIDYYREHQGWEGVETLLARHDALLPHERNAWLTLSFTDAGGHVIYAGSAPMGQPPVPEEHVATLAVRVDGRTRGYLYINWIILNIPDDVQSIVSDQITRGLVALVFLGGILTISAGIIASRSLTAPLSRLAQAAHEFGTMGLNRRVEIRGSVEVVAVANALNEMAAALENAEMLRRNLVADVAHELRTPLTVLRANLQAILDDVYPLNKNELQSLMEQTELLSHLVNDLHELAQVEAKQLPLALDAVDLSTFVDSVAKNFKPVVEAHDVTLTVQTPSSPVMVLADVSRLQQVLNNLLDNALRHTPAGGSITLLLTEETALAHLTVQDSGSGIPAEHLPHVFERFYRVDRSRSRITGGTGLGLTIAKAIVEMHGGHIKVSSSEIPGQGAAFTVSLPRSLP